MSMRLHQHERKVREQQERISELEQELAAKTEALESIAYGGYTYIGIAEEIAKAALNKVGE